MTKKIEIYSKDHCPYCVSAKELLTEKGYAYTEIDALENIEKRNKLAEKHNHYTVPMIFIDEQFVGGFSELQTMDEAGKL